MLAGAARGAGRTVFLVGDIGSGKQTLLDGVIARSRKDPALADAIFAMGSCRRENEAQNAYEPFAEILVSLVSPRARSWARGAGGEELVEQAVLHDAPYGTSRWK